MDAKKIVSGTAYVFLTLAITGLIYVGYCSIRESDYAYADSMKLVASKTPNIQPCFSCIKEGYAQALLFFTLALGNLFLMLFLPRIQTISFGGVNITLKDIKEDMEKLKEQNNLIQEKSIKIGGIRKRKLDKNLEKYTENIRVLVERGEKINEDDVAGITDDPQKDMWGKLPERNNRKLDAVVTRTSLPDIFDLVLTVSSTDDKKPLKGFVTFHLHNTFSNPNPLMAVENGKAVLRLKAYGAFTVGAEADDGKTRLELDLATLPNAPAEFKAR